MVNKGIWLWSPAKFIIIGVRSPFRPWPFCSGFVVHFTTWIFMPKLKFPWIYVEILAFKQSRWVYKLILKVRLLLSYLNKAQAEFSLRSIKWILLSKTAAVLNGQNGISYKYLKIKIKPPPAAQELFLTFLKGAFFLQLNIIHRLIRFQKCLRFSTSIELNILMCLQFFAPRALRFSW